MCRPGRTLAFVPVHTAGQSASLYRLDADKLTLAETGLAAGGLCLAADRETIFVGGSDGQLYVCVSGSAKPLGSALGAMPAALAVVAKERLAVVAGPALLILAKTDGTNLQKLDLPAAG